MVYKNPNPPLPLAFIQNPSRRQHDSLAFLLAWRYAQLLSVLPKRETEAQHWKVHAEHLFSSTALGDEIDPIFGGLASLKGEGPDANGILVDSSIRRCIPCAAPLLQ